MLPTKGLSSINLEMGAGLLLMAVGRMNQTMGKLQKMKPDEYSSFIRVIFGLSSVSPVSEEDMTRETEWVDLSLNDSQKDAIKFALASPEIALIHGPPGVSKEEDVLNMQKSLIEQTDRQDSYVDRTYTTDAKAESASFGLRTF